MKLTFLGHAAILLEGTKNVLLDPFVTNNPKAGVSLDSIRAIDVVCVTHDHDDHLGDAVALAKRDGATLVAIHEVTKRAEVAASKISTVGMNIGGTFHSGEVAVSMTPAVHSAASGAPCGFVIKMDGRRVYHAGDTAVFSDMALIPKLFGKIDVALLPIGGHYVMDAQAAAMAVNFLKPTLTIPIHYNTWPVIAADPNAFVKLCTPRKVKVLDPGEAIDI